MPEAHDQPSVQAGIVSNREADVHRRKLLAAATVGMGGLGIVATAIPFVKSMLPSEAAKAAGAPVEVDLGKVDPGVLLTVEWRGKPAWIVHRTPQMLALLGKHDDQLADPQSREEQQPQYARNPFRAIKPQYFVAVGVCTHLGCTPLYRPEVAPADLGPDWAGGFYCPCHGSKFDMAGRVAKNVPAPRNLEVPQHMYLSEARLLIGADS